VIEYADGRVVSIDDDYMIDQIEGLLAVTSRREQEEIINMLNEVDRNETK
jgi:hypothetical protein